MPETVGTSMPFPSEKFDILSLFLAALSLYLISSTIAVAEEQLIEETVLLETEIDGQETVLETFIVREAGVKEPLPIAVMTHGNFSKPEVRARMKASNFRTVTRGLARRGWLAAFVLRRGYGKSTTVGSDYVLPQCNDRNYDPVIDEVTDDLEATIEAIAARPDADGTEVMAVGISVGSLGALNLASRDLPGLKAVVNFSGGILTVVHDGKEPGPGTCRKEDLFRWLAELGDEGQIPSLWIYAENDRLFGPEFVDEMHAAYTGSGGLAKLYQFGPVGEDGHMIYADRDGMSDWLPVFDQFLHEQGLRTYDAALLEGALAAHISSARAEEAIKMYQGVPVEKALAVSASGDWIAAQFDQPSLDEAETEALQLCEDKSDEECRIIWRNFEIAR